MEVLREENKDRTRFKSIDGQEYAITSYDFGTRFSVEVRRLHSFSATSTADIDTQVTVTLLHDGQPYDEQVFREWEMEKINRLLERVAAVKDYRFEGTVGKLRLDDGRELLVIEKDCTHSIDIYGLLESLQGKKIVMEIQEE